MAPPTVDSESAAEFVATVRAEHVAMKQWYNSDTVNAELQRLKQQYGATYPDLWKEVLNWPGWKETRKAYLKYTQQQQQHEPNATTTTEQQAAPAATVPRKRQSRWGNASSTTANATDAATKRGRWGVADTATATTPTPLQLLQQWPALTAAGTAGGTATTNTHVQQLQAELRALNAKLERVHQEAATVDALPRGHGDRSPSPPPVYGPDGKRQNTRAVRWKERYTAQRQDILEKLLQLQYANSSNTTNNTNSTSFNSSNMAALLRPTKKIKKIPIPIDKHPNYNFIGLIIGPRGKTQKELEAKTGCKIAIRGKGSVKEGARGRRDGQAESGDYDPLHVVVSGDDPRAVDAAATMIEEMLVVIDDERNVHKQQQLRELALLNGTLKDDSDETLFCPVCAEKGHRAFECPKRMAATAATRVKCAICGDTSHPTRDCKLAHGGGTNGSTGTVNQQEIDSEYQSFMAELDGKQALTLPPPPPAAHELQPPPGIPPPLTGGLPPPPVGLPPPPIPATDVPPPMPMAGLPLPPPPSDRGYYYGNQQQLGNNQQQQHGNNYPPPPGQYPPPHGDHASSYPPPPQHQQHYPGHPHHASYPPQQQAPQQQQQPYPQVKPGEETATWDPNAYYGNGGSGGLNWWEQ